MPQAFVDTGAWIALLVQRDQHHEEMRRYFQELQSGTLLSTSHAVIAEAATWLSYHGYHRAAVALKSRVEAAVAAGALSLHAVTESVYESAWEIFERFSDQRFSFCDCTSIVIAREQRADYIVGFDSDFSTMGFTLRP